MSHWNYRIVKYKDGSGYGLHEVFYNAAGEACAMTEDAISFHADDEEGPEGVLKSLQMALKDATERPVFEEPERWALFDGDTEVGGVSLEDLVLDGVSLEEIMSRATPEQRERVEKRTRELLAEIEGEPISNTEALNDRD